MLHDPPPKEGPLFTSGILYSNQVEALEIILKARALRYLIVRRKGVQWIERVCRPNAVTMLSYAVYVWIMNALDG